MYFSCSKKKIGVTNMRKDTVKMTIKNTKTAEKNTLLFFILDNQNENKNE